MTANILKYLMDLRVCVYINVHGILVSAQCHGVGAITLTIT